MAFDTSTDSNYGSAPYAEAAQQARFRLGLRDRLLAGLAGLGSVQPGMSIGQSFIAGLGGSARATWAAQQAAMNYAQRQQDQELERQKNDIYRMQTEAAINHPPKEEKAPPPPKPEKLVQIAGPDGKPVYVRESDAIGKNAYVKPTTPRAAAAPKAPAVKPPKPPSSTQLSNAGVLRTASKAETFTRAMEDKMVGVGLGGQLALKAPHFMQTPEMQKYVQAQNWWIENVLRQVSGATIKPSEYGDYRRIYFAQPGDSKELADQKRQSRQTKLDALRAMSGTAADSVPKVGADSSKADPLGIR